MRFVHTKHPIMHIPRVQWIWGVGVQLRLRGQVFYVGR